MATFDKRFKKYHGCGVIRKTIGGSFVGEFNRDDRRRRQTFDTLKEAEDWLNDFGAARDNSGKVVTLLSSPQLQDAFNAFDFLTRNGHPDVSLFAIAEAYTLQARATETQAEVGTVQSWYEKYMAHLEQPIDGGDKARPRTIKGKRLRLRSFLETHGETDAASITGQDVTDWLLWTGATDRNLLNFKTEVQSLFNFIEKRNGTFKNTVARFPQRKRKEVPAAEILKPKQAAKLLRELELIDPTCALVVAIGCFAGLRTAEIVGGHGLLWSNIDFDNSEIRVPASQTKIRKARSVKITDNLMAWLQRYRFTEDGNERAGKIAPHERTFWKRKKAAAKKAKVQQVDNGARHSFGTYYGRLYGYRNASELMGHSGTMSIFESHYKGNCTDAEATEYFQIMPIDGAAKIIKMEGVA